MDASECIQKCRVFPSVKPEGPQRAPLSILDATVARFGPTGAVWLYDELPEGVAETVFLETLRRSLAETLDDFPQWAGQLQWAETRPGGGHTERFNRAVLVWGTDADPGVGWGVVRHPFRLDSVVPGPAERAFSGSSPRHPGAWTAPGFPAAAAAMLPATPFALHDLVEHAGLPGLAAQVNLFAAGGGGGWGVGVKFSHVLADAHTLTVFVGRWAAASRRALALTLALSTTPGGPGRPEEPGPGPGTRDEGAGDDPVFDPAALDARAAGDIDAAAPYPALAAAARALPLHRFDWWDTAAPGFSPAFAPLTEASRPPPELLAAATGALWPGTRAPWHTWDLSRPARPALLHFSGAELESLKKAAAADADAAAGGGGGGPAVNISRLDALLAHLFRAVNSARFGGKPAPSSSAAGTRGGEVEGGADEEEEEEEGEVDVFLDVTLDARRRVSPPLPDTFLGSPLFLTHVKAAVTTTTTTITGAGGGGGGGGGVLSKGLGEVARELRRTMQLFTPDALGAMLHDAAQEPSLQRLWQAFVGRRHVLVTSWLRLPLYEIDFVGGGGGGGGGAGGGGSRERRRPRYVHPFMPECDGVVVVSDSAVGDAGIDVGLFLDEEAMARLLRDEEGELRRFRI